MNFCLYFLGLIWVIISPPTLAQTQTFDITPERIGPFCPTYLTEGDRDFGGTPRIDIRTELSIAPDRQTLRLSIRFHAREEGGDHTTVEQTVEHLLWTAPDGHRIVSYAVLANFGNAGSRWSEPRQRTYQDYCNYDDCAQDLIRQPKFVEQYRVIGNTSGDDVSQGGPCDDNSTNYSLVLSLLKVTCVSINSAGAVANNTPSQPRKFDPQYRKPPVNAMVSLYADCDYQGAGRSIGVGRYNWDQMGLPNDALSSLRMSPGMVVVLYNDADFRGRSTTITENVSCLTDRDANDQTSSIEVRRVPARKKE